MIKSLFAAKHPNIATLLARADDHLLDDIGLTRFDVEVLMREGTSTAPKLRLTAVRA